MAPPRQRFCKSGHDIALVGRNSGGNCRECRRESEVARRLRSRGLNTYHPLPRLREFRLAKGYTIRSLAAEAGVSKPTILNAEHGQRVRLRTVLLLSAALRVRPPQLLEDPEA